MSDSYRAVIGGESGLVRVLAPNPTPMTHTGTNTYLVGEGEVAVIDPGPEDRPHLTAIMEAIGGRRVHCILLTHTHRDHSGGARMLADVTGAPLVAFGTSTAGRSDTMQRLAPLVGGGEGVDHGFHPDATLADGEQIMGDGWTIRAHHTPGHMANHLSFHWLEGDTVFTGDTVMGWASTLISPPDGDLGQFYGSLDTLEDLGAGQFLPGHGEPVAHPVQRCRELRDHRRNREAAILALLDRPRTISNLVEEIYAETPPALHPAAARNVLAHLVYLAQSGDVIAVPGLAPDALFTRR